MSASVAFEAADYIRARLPKDFNPECAVVLGSGLSALADQVHSPIRFSYKEMPGFVPPSTEGHKGELLIGTLGGRRVALLSGRIHFYEGYSMDQVTFSVRVMGVLGVKTLALTAAVGGIHKKLRVGDVVVLKDHLNFMGDNPLRGIHHPAFGERFPDLSECYSPRLRALALSLAKKRKLRAVAGVYAAVSGPSYETPAEISAFRSLGADVVGMSTVPETIVARQMGLNVVALCLVSNAAAGVSKKKLSHSEVMESGRASSAKLSALLADLVRAV